MGVINNLVGVPCHARAMPIHPANRAVNLTAKIRIDHFERASDPIGPPGQQRIDGSFGWTYLVEHQTIPRGTDRFFVRSLSVLQRCTNDLRLAPGEDMPIRESRVCVNIFSAVKRPGRVD